MNEKHILTEKIKEIAASCGIDALGFTDASEFPDYALNDSIRQNPKHSLADAETIIVAGIYIGGVTLPSWSNPWYGRTSRLYLSGYFSDIIEPLKPIAHYLRNEGYKAIICNSSTSEGSIIPLKLAAIRAGLGWQGKNSLLVTKKFGTFLALGGILTDALLEHNKEEEPNRCVKCNRCREACPLSALDRPFELNRAKCLSLLLQTDELPQEAQLSMENRVGDCEICQQICPWNKKHLENPLPTKLTLAFQAEIKKWEEIFYLPDLAEMTEETYIEIFSRLNTGIPYNIFHRNVLIALEKATALNK